LKEDGERLQKLKGGNLKIVKKQLISTWFRVYNVRTEEAAEGRRKRGFTMFNPLAICDSCFNHDVDENREVGNEEDRRLNNQREDG